MRDTICGRECRVGVSRWLIVAACLAWPAVAPAAAPTSANQSVSVVQGGSAWFFLSITDPDTSVYGTGMMVTVVSPPTKGVVGSYAQINNYLYGYNNYLRYTSTNTAFSGADSFTWYASDGTGTSAVAKVSVTITANNPPVANGTSNAVPCGVQNSIYLSTTHSDSGQTLAYELVTPPSHGSGYISGNYFYYTSVGTYVGPDSFTWRVSDGIVWSAPATAVVTVMPSIPVPQVQSVIVKKGASTVLSPNFTGGGGFTCKPVHPTGYMQGPYYGSVALTNNGTQFVYTPNSNFAGGARMYTPGQTPPGGMNYFLWYVTYSNATSSASNSAAVPFYINVTDRPSITNSDWTQWMHDELRSAQTPMSLPSTLYLQWRRDLPTAVNPYPSYPNAEYCRPVQLGKTLYVGLVANDSVSAYDTDTGAQKWRYYASGALRRPPVALRLGSGQAAALPDGGDVVIFGSDDGYVYCLNGADGSEIWKFRGAPNSKKAMGFGRLSSVWPIWASPTIDQGKVYFVAGLLPSWGMFAYCLDAATGAQVWRNDGRMLDEGCTSTMGPPTASYDHSRFYLTSGQNQCWALDAVTGETGPAPAATSSQKYFVDGNSDGATESMSLVAGGRPVTASAVAALGVSGTVVSMLAGDGKLFVVTAQGSLYCFGGTSVTPTIYPYQTTPLTPVTDTWTTAVGRMLSREDLKQGLALVWGVGSGQLVEELAVQAPGLSIVAADPDPAKLRAIRVKMDAAGWSGARVSTVLGNPMECGFAPYQAALIASEDAGVAGYSNGLAMVKMLYRCTRPFGGEIWLPTTGGQDAAISGWMSSTTSMPLFVQSAWNNGFTRLQRTGLPDSKLTLKPPFRLIAFNSYLKFNTQIGSGGLQRGTKNGLDIYSWLPVTATEIGYEPPAPAYNNTFSNPYVNGIGRTMWNVLYSRMESTAVAGSASPGGCGRHGVGGPTFYGDYRMVDGKVSCLTSQPQDTSQFWGAFNFADRGGCSLFGEGGNFAGNGIFAFSGNNGCTCVPGLLGMQGEMVPVDDDENEENWLQFRNTRSSARIQEDPVQQIGVNFGSAGDRYLADEQMLWTHHPASTLYFGESPVLLPASYRGHATSVYHHSAQMDTTAPLSKGWVSASQVIGMDGITIPLATPLVATRTEPPPTLDGDLREACWATGPGTEISPTKLWLATMGNVNSNNYVKFRYDHDNLYIAGCIPAALAAARSIHGTGRCGVSPYYLKLTMNSRERSGSDLVLTCGPGGMTSTGIGTNEWLGAYSTSNGAPFSVEIAIPWSALATAGLWKDNLIMNVNFTLRDGYGGIYRTALNPEDYTGAALAYSPVYLDAARGPVAQAKPHTVRLYFAEMEGLKAGQRVFDVKLQGQTVLADLDIVSLAGGPCREWTATCSNVMIASELNIDFTPKAGQPMLSGVELAGTYATPRNVPPVAFADASTASGPAPLAVTLSAQRSYDPDGQISECAWETGDGRLARGPSVQHVFAEPGTYKVNLLVADNRGGTAASSVTVTVTPGVPAAFVSRIRASGGDYTNLTTWNAAIASDLTSSSMIFQVSSPGTYVAADNGKTITFTNGVTGVLRWVATNLTPAIAAVANVSGAVTPGDVVIGGGHVFTVSDTGTAAQSLLFAVNNPGSYAAGADDGKVVSFAGGGVGILKHINSSAVAYIAECRGAVGVGTVTVAGSGHTFSVADAGHPIYTAVAEGYNDWPSGLADGPAITGWITDGNHAVVVRAAAGHGHSGVLKNGANYAGFAFSTLDSSTTPHSRFERIIVVGSMYSIFHIGDKGSANRVLNYGPHTRTGAQATIANSVFSAPSYDVAGAALLLNCTGASLQPGLFAGARAINCLSTFSSQTRESSYRHYCVSMDGTATNLDVWGCGSGGNLANRTVAFVNSAGKDYRLADADEGARGLGVPGLGADVTGAPRSGPYYDVGAYQNQSAMPDLNGNGIPDIWEIQHFGSTNAPSGRPGDDFDGDGMSNGAEYKAWTDPIDALSRLEITGAGVTSGTNFVIRWSSVGSKFYSIDSSTNLSLGFPFNVISNIPATPNVNSHTVDVHQVTQQFFRIRVQ